MRATGVNRGRRRARTIVCAGAVVLATLSAGCGGSDATKPSTSAASKTTASAASKPATVVIDTFMFSPTTLHVHVGDTVTWTNHDDILHTVTSGTREYESGDSGHVTATHKSGEFDMQLDGKGATATHTFTKPGTVHYFCDRHPGMEADVVVS